MRRGHRLSTCVALFTAAVWGMGLHAQANNSRVPVIPNAGAGQDRSGDPMYGLDSGEIRIHMQNARKDQQRRHIVDSANRLLEAARQLRTVAAAGPVTAENEKQLDEIARLARSVKDQMASR